MPVAIPQDICISKLSISRVTEQCSMNMQSFNGADNQNAEYKLLMVWAKSEYWQSNSNVWKCRMVIKGSMGPFAHNSLTDGPIEDCKISTESYWRGESSNNNKTECWMQFYPENEPFSPPLPTPSHFPSLRKSFLANILWWLSSDWQTLNWEEKQSSFDKFVLIR